MKNKIYVLDYIDENDFKKRERSLKLFIMLAYKKLMFEYYPNIRKGNFLGDIVSQDKKEKTTSYSLKLPADSLFEKVHGKITLEYIVYEKQGVILLKTILPDILLEGHTSELSTYKGVMVSKSHSDKDMFKINLLNMLNRDN